MPSALRETREVIVLEQSIHRTALQGLRTAKSVEIRRLRCENSLELGRVFRVIKSSHYSSGEGMSNDVCLAELWLDERAKFMAWPGTSKTCRGMLYATVSHAP
jgi:hypothetical protein